MRVEGGFCVDLALGGCEDFYWSRSRKTRAHDWVSLTGSLEAVTGKKNARSTSSRVTWSRMIPPRVLNTRAGPRPRAPAHDLVPSLQTVIAWCGVPSRPLLSFWLRCRGERDGACLRWNVVWTRWKRVVTLVDQWSLANTARCKERTTYLLINWFESTKWHPVFYSFVPGRAVISGLHTCPFTLHFRCRSPGGPCRRFSGWSAPWPPWRAAGPRDWEAGGKRKLATSLCWNLPFSCSKSRGARGDHRWLWGSVPRSGRCEHPCRTPAAERGQSGPSGRCGLVSVWARGPPPSVVVPGPWLAACFRSRSPAT